VDALVELQESVAVPDPVMLDGVIIPHVRPAGTVSVTDTFPANPFSPVIVMVDMADWPASIAAGEVAVMVKSVTVNVAVVEWLRVPLVPIIVSV